MTESTDPHAPALGSGAHKPADRGVREHGSGAHGAGLQRDKKRAAVEAVVAKSARGLAQGNDFGVGCRVTGADDGILPARDHLASANNDSADGHFTGRSSFARLGECGLHRFEIGDHAFDVSANGCCCVMQCRVPSPHTRSTAWMPMTSRSEKSSARIPRAIRSLGSWKVGTRTRPLAM